jgi:hypothetical protein
MPKTDKEFKAMKKADIVAYAKELEMKLTVDETDALIRELVNTKTNLELTQEEAAGMSETIRMKNAKEQVTSNAVANLINGINLALDNASTMLESIGVISKGGRK